MSNEIIIGNQAPIKGELTPPGDKSISHRSVIIGSLAKGTSIVRGFLDCDDANSSINAMKMLGVPIEARRSSLEVKGNGLHGLTKPRDTIDAGNSGTTARLLMGLLSAENFSSEITGDKYLRARPMRRVVDPLRLMGADITGSEDGNKLPISIKGGKLRGISYEPPVASAQVKSAILLAGLYAQGETEVIESKATRDHTERMLSFYGVDVITDGNRISIEKLEEDFKGAELLVPADISSAAFFIVAALINPGSEVVIYNVGLNPLRAGIIDILKRMGGNIEIVNFRDTGCEPVADILVKSSDLRATEIKGEIIPKAIDELPVIAVAACFSEGETVIREARELRAKETDRIKAVTQELRKLGASIEELDDGMVIRGTGALRGAKCSGWGDHRIAMALAVAGTRAEGETEIEGAECVSVSYPGFFYDLRQLRK
jgi:3-phosphoshikimate 1-carboxyvinyltransferase